MPQTKINKTITFLSNGVKCVGHLYLPAEKNENCHALLRVLVLVVHKIPLQSLQTQKIFSTDI
ncbi:hypothetical protein [Metabacillus arenae]|uniref:Uncharacterized protein n=1 Tax=Metabacillus arenae TaxID=2771434 RepID=A0A926RXG1_9BACI|nr:hypothetical protein [Metabacillus arenae]MBD1381843.1 hypothetical protein [Metabacillus arenae]